MERGIAIETFKMAKNLSGVSNTRLTPVNHPYESRSISATNFYQEFAKTERRKNAFICRSAAMWRKIPSNVKLCTTTATFKVNYDKWKKTQVIQTIS